MLVERGLQVMNVEVVGDAYAIAANYLRKTGAKTSSPPSKRTAELPARGAVATTVTGSNSKNIMRPHAVPQTPKTQRKRAIPTTHISKLSRVKRIASKKRGRTVDPHGP